ncbi:hypothetical protein KOW79_011891 [Hemibagrus wyckioides]|uniref:Uncharacterized protein n=1 Tax=Hemibagrus wyckioides TaxID=337641 RepID=A0A9D3NKP5_9TELE|nr:hypothetical protein KOW79_011891 [Hemibagrus wyckioides]
MELLCPPRHPTQNQVVHESFSTGFDTNLRSCRRECGARRPHPSPFATALLAGGPAVLPATPDQPKISGAAVSFTFRRDSDLEAFSHNPTDGNRTSGSSAKHTRKCLNLRFLSQTPHLPLSRAGRRPVDPGLPGHREGLEAKREPTRARLPPHRARRRRTGRPRPRPPPSRKGRGKGGVSADHNQEIAKGQRRVQSRRAAPLRPPPRPTRRPARRVSDPGPPQARTAQTPAAGGPPGGRQRGAEGGRKRQEDTPGGALSAGRRRGAGRRSPAAARAQPAAPGPTDPALRANPYPKFTDLTCRLRLPTLFQHARGCSPWRPAADMECGPARDLHPLPDFQGPARAHGRRQNMALSEARAPISG